MRLAYLSTDPGIAYGGAKGASVHLYEVTRAMAARGAEVLLLVSGVASGAPPPPPGVALEPLPGTFGDKDPDPDGALAELLVDRLKGFGAVVLYERLALHSTAGAAAAQRLGIPHIVEVNAPLREEAARYRRLERPRMAERMEMKTLRGADLVIAVSPPLADYARRLGARRVQTLQNAVAIDRYPPRPSSDGRRAVAVFAGSLKPWHGVETIADAWRLLGSSAPDLLVVGDGPAMRHLDGVRARRLGWLDPDRVPAVLVGADIGLAPYSKDAPRYFSPLKLFEYLAAGLGAIVADLPAVKEVVSDESAMLIPSGDAEALAEATAELVSDEGKRRRLGENGRALVAAAHTWERRADRLLGAAAELAGLKAARA